MATRDGRPEVDVNDFETLFLHDLPGPIVKVMRSDPSAAAEGPAVFAQPWPLSDWPEVPTRVLSGRDDRFFPFPLEQRVARDRLGIEAEEVPGGHLGALSHPVALTDKILRP